MGNHPHPGNKDREIWAYLEKEKDMFVTHFTAEHPWRKGVICEHLRSCFDGNHQALQKKLR